LPKDVTLHVARLPLAQIATDSIGEHREPIEVQSRALATADVDVIVLGAAAPSFLKGLATTAKWRENRAASGKRATTTSTALVEALKYSAFRAWCWAPLTTTR